MNPDLIDALWRRATGGESDIGQFKGKLTLGDGEAAQLRLLERWCDQGESLAGWKVGLTSGRSRDAFGKGFRPFGFILKSRIAASPARVALARIQRCGVENELCFVMDRALEGAAVTAAEARAAVRGVAPAFEINETRLAADADNALRVADDLSQWGIVVGEIHAPLPPRFDFDSVEVVLSRDGKDVERVAARGHIDDHFESIAALARELAKFGRGLRAGDHIITGAFTRQAVASPSRWEGRFSGLGSVSVQFVGDKRGRRRL